MDKSIYSQLQVKLQHLLREMRLEEGLRQIDLASMLDQPQSFISKYESGERILDFLELRQICEALRVRMSEFIDRFERDADET